MQVKYRFCNRGFIKILITGLLFTLVIFHNFRSPPRRVVCPQCHPILSLNSRTRQEVHLYPMPLNRSLSLYSKIKWALQGCKGQVWDQGQDYWELVSHHASLFFSAVCEQAVNDLTERPPSNKRRLSITPPPPSTSLECCFSAPYSTNTCSLQHGIIRSAAVIEYPLVGHITKCRKIWF